ncbi:hypothetical protein N8373_00395 [Gammaproteobacteria bacterium]|jgi:hypothetical protein|nr:hypothetical protein [Gammaproteobacteria bacterium]|tara:strand:- start:74 stop:1222 length:1149 start_codon:yes stop_codon:yes gene_type:complete
MSKQNPTSICFDLWPDGDKRLWSAAISAGNFLDPDGAASHWAAATKTQVQKGYGKWIYHLNNENLLTYARATTPSSRVNENSLRSFITRLEAQGLASQTIASRLTDLTEAIRVMEPASDLSLLKKISSSMQLRASPSRKKNSRIKPPHEIWQACLCFMRELITSNPTPNMSQSSRYRDALALGLLALRPLRRRNTSNLILGKHLTLDHGVWNCVIPGEETKDGEAIAFTLPQNHAFTHVFNRYLTTERQVLLKQPLLNMEEVSFLRGPLWLTNRCRIMSDHAFYYAIVRISTELLGVPINPHLLRDCAVSAISSDAPENILAASRILGHSNLKTTLSHYEQSSMLAAGANLMSTIQKIQTMEPLAEKSETDRLPFHNFKDLM